MIIKIFLRKEEFIFKIEISLKQAFQELELIPESYLALRNGELITESELLRDGDVVKLIPVISGGVR